MPLHHGFSPDIPPHPGLRSIPDGAGDDPTAKDVVEVAVVAKEATAVWLCLREDDGAERRVPLRHQVHGIWFDQVADVPPGTPYCFRACLLYTSPSPRD